MPFILIYYQQYAMDCTRIHQQSTALNSIKPSDEIRQTHPNLLQYIIKGRIPQKHGLLLGQRINGIKSKNINIIFLWMSNNQTKNRLRKHIYDGLFKAELHSFLSKALDDCGYSGFDLTNTLPKPEIILKVTNTKPLLDDNQRKIRELESLIQKRWDYKPDGIHIKVQRLKQKGLCAAAMAESIKLKLLAQVPVRAAVSSVIRQCVDKEKAKGCEVIVSGKLSQQRAKSMKFKKGYMISSGQAKKDYLEIATRHVMLKQGVMGVKVKIMKEYDPKNIQCASVPLPDNVEFLEVKKEEKEEKFTTKAVDTQ